MKTESSECIKGEWLDEYSVGNKTLDNQHKGLLKLCQKMRVCLSDNTKAGDSLFHEILNDLSDYASKHFKDEEKILRDCGYPRLAEHTAEHDAYFEWLTTIILEATEGKIDKEALRQRIADWWITHICESDMDYKNLIGIRR